MDEYVHECKVPFMRSWCACRAKHELSVSPCLPLSLQLVCRVYVCVCTYVCVSVHMCVCVLLYMSSFVPTIGVPCVCVRTYVSQYVHMCVCVTVYSVKHHCTAW